nr:solute carrier family 2, facilitated glucose transporter member 1-like [Lepeophtheirus salmonis]
MSMNGRLAFAIAAGAFGSSFQHGYNTGVLNAPQVLITNWLRGCEKNMTAVTEDGSDVLVCEKDMKSATMIWAIIVSIFCVGGMIGGTVVGTIASRVGRKGGLMWNNILAILGALLLFFSKMSGSAIVLILGRLVIGINSGINAGLSPMYLSEISPTSMRGAVGTVYQLIITMSILLAQILGMSSVLGNEAGWPYLLGLTVFPAILQLVTLPLCPESPKYLLLDVDDEQKALSSLNWLRGKVEVHDEIEEMKNEKEATKNMKTVSFMEIITNSSLRKPLIVAQMMMLAQQLSGINAAMFYSTSIFESAGLSLSESQYATLAMGAMNVGMTLVSLVLIERAGRKTLMLIGLFIMFITTILLMLCLLLSKTVAVLSYVSIIMVIGFVIGFATGPGSIPWFFVTELFTQNARGMATSIAVVTNWTANTLVGLGFAPFQYILGPYVFLFFIIVQFLFIIYVKFQVPETKNKTIEEITAVFKN